MEHVSLGGDHRFFAVSKTNQIGLIRLNERAILHTTDLEQKEDFFRTIDQLIDDPQVKVIVVKGSPEKVSGNEFARFYETLSKQRVNMWGADIKAISRFYNGVSQFVTKLASASKITITADSGPTPLFHLGISLAYDVRIAADNLVYTNVSQWLGCIPNGGLTYFLTRNLGRKKAFDLLMSDENIPAKRALKLGLVDQVVPVDNLEEAALDLAKTYAQKSIFYLCGIKQLACYDLQMLKQALEKEVQILQTKGEIFN